MTTANTKLAPTLHIGSFSITPLLDGHGHEPAREVLTKPEEASDPWTCHHELLDEQGRLPLVVGGHLIRTPDDRVVIVDAGVGTVDNGKYKGGQFLESLRDQGLETEDVTDVLLTHLHFDHVGWTSRKGEVVFPNATYHIHQSDWEYFVDSESAIPGAVRKLEPLRSQLSLFSAEQTLLKGIDARPAPGHTPGSTSFVISHRHEKAVMIGDLAHAYIQLEDPEWSWAHDISPSASREARAAFVDEFVNSDTAIIGAHFPEMRAGKLQRLDNETTWSWL